VLKKNYNGKDKKLGFLTSSLRNFLLAVIVPTMNRIKHALCHFVFLINIKNNRALAELKGKAKQCSLLGFV
jgi:hypothetical protein